MRTDLLLLGVPVACLAAFLAFQLCRYASWVWRGGTRIEIPWSSETPPYSWGAHRWRTRSGVAFDQPATGICALLCWRRGPDATLGELLFDAVTGSTGIATVALDFGLKANGASWVITSGEYSFSGTELSGPHYAPLEACKGSALARINIAGVIDAAQLLACVQSMIRDPTVRHKGNQVIPYFLGTTREDRVTCSSLIGCAILKQASQPLAQALRQALKERFTYGEISPADLARAAAILNLSTAERPAGPIRAIPILTRREPTVHATS